MHYFNPSEITVILFAQIESDHFSDLMRPLMIRNPVRYQIVSRNYRIHSFMGYHVMQGSHRLEFPLIMNSPGLIALRALEEFVRSFASYFGGNYQVSDWPIQVKTYSSHFRQFQLVPRNVV